MKFFSAIILLGILTFCQCREKKDAKVAAIYKTQLLNDLTRKIQEDPKSPSLWIQRATAFNDAQMYQEAVIDIAQAMHLDSTNIGYHHLLSDVYLNMTNSNLAMITMERAIKLDPENPTNLIKGANLYLILRKYDKAINLLNDALKTDPHNAEVFLYLGMIFKETGDTTRSINAFQTATENDHEMIDAWLNLGQLYDKKNNPLAERFFKNAMDIRPDDPAVMHFYADYLYRKGNVEKAKQLYKNIIEINREYADAYHNLGTIYLNSDSLDKAFIHFDMLQKVDPLSSKAVFLKGVVKEKQGIIKEAYTYYSQASKMSPDYIEAQEAVKRLKKMLEK